MNRQVMWSRSDAPGMEHLALIMRHGEEAERLGGNLSLIYTNRSLIYKKKGDFDKALTELNAPTETDPNFYGAFLERAQLYYKFGKHNQAIEDLNKVINLEPDNTIALHYRGLIYQETGAKGQAISDFIAMLERSSDAQTRVDAKKHLMELGVYK